MDMLLISEKNEYMKVNISPALKITFIESGNFRSAGIVWTDYNKDYEGMMAYLTEIYEEDPQLYGYVYKMCQDDQPGLLPPEEVNRIINTRKIEYLDLQIQRKQKELDSLIAQRNAI